jgi:hypothetical protein
VICFRTPSVGFSLSLLPSKETTLVEPGVTLGALRIGAPLRAFRTWRHAGEESAVVVYSKAFWGQLVYQCCILLAVGAYIPFMRLSLTIIAMLIVPRTLAEGRRAVIFNPTEVIYRPPFARPARAPIEGINTLRRSKVTMFYWLRPRRAKGVLIGMADGTKVVLPLDFKGPNEILQRLSAATGKAIQE